jgi:hypothetical protein
MKEWCAIPIMPGLLLGAVTPFVGVNPDDNLLLYVAVALNSTMRGLITYMLYPLFTRKRQSA